jgi:Ca2+-binding EF-hand superfamily protein
VEISHLHTSSSSSEPHAGFKIAFNMFDADGNQMVDKREFLVVSYPYCSLNK